MNAINLAEAKAALSALVKRAAAGETITILKRGKPVATLAPATRTYEPLDLEELRRFTDSLPPHKPGDIDVVRAMRDDARY
ncbi:type II toxin-antitoxin system prevent-host-death family antitoxin [Sandaracinobacteroides saxicola]|uniref:Antitoxin n=1 Tax=Sandaracinobacteroides saxicola TaxID=2759707 RepID=A0A7G5IMV3_9SPHN|nr:type II toxin-antitoxin system prevent-host-death family antitoxin [Sandaracinobacteroides saxicola]